MKKKILILIVILFIISNSFAQNNVKGTLYTTNSWADSKGKGSWDIAMDNLTYETVKVLLTEKYITVTFGTKVLKYAIISKKKFSEFQMDYNVTFNKKSYVLSVVTTIKGLTDIGIEDIWYIPDIKSKSEIEVIE